MRSDMRDYQKSAYDAVLSDLGEAQSTLIVFATGLGKTHTFGHVAKHFAQTSRVLVLAHREELIHQAADKLSKITGEMPEIEMAGLWADQPNLANHRSKCVVSSIQTQVSGMGGKGRMTRFDPSDFGLVIVDEAHHATADTYKRVLAHYRQNPNLKVLGVTATPDRSDEEALGQVFDRVSAVYDIADGISDGWLAPIVQRSVEVEGLDFSTVRTTAGDLNGADLAAIMEYEENLHSIAHPTLELSAGRKTLVFAASVAHAERMSEIFNRHRQDCARFICGTTDDVTRKQTLRDFSLGRFQILTNVAVLTEGYDEPSIELVVMARPTKSRALFAQCVGRGTRPLAGVLDGCMTPESRRDAIAASSKPHLEVLDFVGNCGRHKLVTCADILGGNYSEAVVAQAAAMARTAGRPVDMQLLLLQASEELDRQRHEQEERARAEAANRAKLVAKASYSTNVVSAFDVLDITPAHERGWDKGKPASHKQVEILRKAGIPNPAELSAKHASQLIGTMFKRREEEKCTFKQARILKKHGYSPDSSFTEARSIIDALAANGWQRPKEAATLVGATEGEI